MAQSQAERTRKYHEKNGIRSKTFALDPETVALLERGESQTAVFKAALRLLAATE